MEQKNVKYVNNIFLTRQTTLLVHFAGAKIFLLESLWYPSIILKPVVLVNKDDFYFCPSLRSSFAQERNSQLQST